MKEMRRHRGCLRIVMGCAAASAAGLGLEAHRAEEGGGVGAAYLVVVEQLGQLSEGLAELAYELCGAGGLIADGLDGGLHG